jgi:hypothetical protein
VTERVPGIHNFSNPLYRCCRTVSTACSSAFDAWIRRRKALEPSDERSRSSRRRRGFRLGVTFWDRMGSCAECSVCGAVSLCAVLKGCVGGSAEDCGGGGVASDVEDMVWYCFVLSEDIGSIKGSYIQRNKLEKCCCLGCGCIGCKGEHWSYGTRFGTDKMNSSEVHMSIPSDASLSLHIPLLCL